MHIYYCMIFSIRRTEAWYHRSTYRTKQATCRYYLAKLLHLRKNKRIHTLRILQQISTPKFRPLNFHKIIHRLRTYTLKNLQKKNTNSGTIRKLPLLSLSLSQPPDFEIAKGCSVATEEPLSQLVGCIRKKFMHLYISTMGKARNDNKSYGAKIRRGHSIATRMYEYRYKYRYILIFCI